MYSCGGLCGSCWRPVLYSRVVSWCTVFVLLFVFESFNVFVVFAVMGVVF